MDQALWEKVRSVFDSAVSLPASDHADFLDHTCAGDTQLRTEVENLLQHLERADGFLSLDEPHSLLQPGDLISDRYRVITHIGSGGMGDVYEVEDRDLQEVVALKTFRLDTGGALGTLEHLKREMRHARRIVHRNVCRHFDLGYDAANSRATAYLTMERIHGEPLTSYLRRRDGIGEQEALRLAEQLCSGVGAAHEQKIIHGDLKTGNLVYAESERRLVILDFGLSRFNPNEDGGAGALSRRVAGTPAYLAPERYEGNAASYASDIYSLGVILHELIAGQLPPAARDDQGRRQVAASVPPRWSAAIVACLSLNPAERPETPAAVARMLAPGMRIPGITGRQLSRVAGVAIGVAAVALGIVYLPQLGAFHRHVSAAAPAVAVNAPVSSDGQPGARDLFHTGETYLDRRTPLSLDRAIVAFQQGLAKDPKNAVANAKLSQAFSDKYASTARALYLKEASDSLAVAEQMAPDSSETLLARGMIERSRGQLGEAESTLKKSVALNQTNGEAWRQLARTYSQAGNVLAAQATYEEGVKLNSSYWILYTDLGWFYATHGQYDHAENELQAARQLAPDQSIIFANLGGIYLATGKLNEARDALSQALTLEPSADVASNLGTVYFDLGQFRAAARAYREACTLSPKDNVLWGNLGDALQQDGKLSEAKTAYAQAAALASESLQGSPSSSQLLSVLALYYAKEGLFHEAQQYQDKALKISPHDLGVLLLAASTEELAGKRQAALQYIENALEAGASLQTIDGTFELKRLRQDPAYAKIAKEWGSVKPPHPAS
jgi:serine/threonine protein kinase/tetratricopeptide (TPR) repeat protein